MPNGTYAKKLRRLSRLMRDASKTCPDFLGTKKPDKKSQILPTQKPEIQNKSDNNTINKRKTSA